MTMPRISSISAPDMAYGWLKNTIFTLPRDEELFLSETQVAAASGTSRTPVREALLRLEAEGFVRRVPHKGAYVPALTDKDVDDVMQARRIVEEWSISQVAPNPGLIPERLHDLVNRQEADTDPVEFIAHDLEFHTTVIKAAGNQVMLDFYRSLRDRQMRMGVRIVLSDEHRKKQVLVEHAAIVDALAAQDTEVAIRAVREHLDTTQCSLKQPRF
ncbi:GntR family transcriptional regulator [Nocardia sp. NPDC004750]